jgi:hypothetical protein
MLITLEKTESTIKSGKSGDTVNIGHKTKNEDKLNIKTTWKNKKTRNTDPTKNPEMDLFGYY